MEELEIAWKEAYSLPPEENRAGMIFIGIKETENNTYYFYREYETGKYYYKSAATEKFHKKMKEREKERKECSRRLKSGLREKNKQQSA